MSPGLTAGAGLCFALPSVATATSYTVALFLQSKSILFLRRHKKARAVCGPGRGVMLSAYDGSRPMCCAWRASATPRRKNFHSSDSAARRAASALVKASGICTECQQSAAEGSPIQTYPVNVQPVESCTMRL